MAYWQMTYCYLSTVRAQSCDFWRLTKVFLVLCMLFKCWIYHQLCGGGTTRWPWQTNLNMLNQSNWRVGGNKCCVCSMPAIHRNLLFGSSFKTFWQINVVLLRGEYGRMAETKRSWRKGTTRSGACGLILFTGGAVLFGSFCKFNEHIVVLSALVGIIFKHGHHIKGRQQARKFPNLSAGR